MSEAQQAALPGVEVEAQERKRQAHRAQTLARRALERSGCDARGIPRSVAKGVRALSLLGSPHFTVAELLEVSGISESSYHETVRDHAYFRAACELLEEELEAFDEETRRRVLELNAEARVAVRRRLIEIALGTVTMPEEIDEIVDRLVKRHGAAVEVKLPDIASGHQVAAIRHFDQLDGALVDRKSIEGAGGGPLEVLLTRFGDDDETPAPLPGSEEPGE